MSSIFLQLLYIVHVFLSMWKMLVTSPHSWIIVYLLEDEPCYSVFDLFFYASMFIFSWMQIFILPLHFSFLVCFMSLFFILLLIFFSPFIQLLSFQKCADFTVQIYPLTATSSPLLQSAGAAYPASKTEDWLTSFSASLHKSFLAHTPRAHPIKITTCLHSLSNIHVQAFWMLRALKLKASFIYPFSLQPFWAFHISTFHPRVVRFVGPPRV